MPSANVAAERGTKATTGSLLNPLNPSGATPTIVYLPDPMSSAVPRMLVCPPNCVCQKPYERTVTAVPDGGTSSAGVKNRPMTGRIANIFHRSAPVVAMRISRVASPIPTARLGLA